MVHGSFRTSIIYISGVLAGMRHAVSAVLMAVSAALAVLMNVKTVRFPVTSELSLFTGSLGTSVFDQGVYLVGASGGVYALLSAHLANVLLVCIQTLPVYQCYTETLSRLSFPVDH